MPYPRVYAIMFMRRLFNRRQRLNVIGNDNAGDTTLRFGDAHSPIYKVPDLRRIRSHVYVLMSYIFKEGDQVDFLLIMAADSHPGRMPHNSNNGLMIHLCIVQSIEQVDGAWTRSGEAHADLSCKFRMGAGHKRGGFLMTYLYEWQRILSS